MDYKTWSRTLSELNQRHRTLLDQQQLLQAKRLSGVRSRTLLYRLNEVFIHADLADAVFQDLCSALVVHITDVVTTKGNISVGASSPKIGNAGSSMQEQLDSLMSINVKLLNSSLENLLDILAVSNVTALVKVLEVMAGQLPGYGTWIGACGAIRELVALLKSDLQEADKKLFELECFEFAVLNASALAVLHVNHFLTPLPLETMENLSIQEALELVRGEAMKEVHSKLADVRARNAIVSIEV